MYQSLLSAKSVTISINISIIIITIRRHCCFVCPLFFLRVFWDQKLLRKDERGNIFVSIFRSEEVILGDRRRAGDGWKKKLPFKKIALVVIERR